MFCDRILSYHSVSIWLFHDEFKYIKLKEKRLNKMQKENLIIKIAFYINTIIYIFLECFVMLIILVKLIFD